jgi:mannose-6-phosphate isomerase-like protein (cupin superfamily)
MPDSTKSPAPMGRVAHATVENAPFVAGRRDFFKYRDLGVMDASNGVLRAQTMTAVKHMTEPTGWHYHECAGQFVYVIKGWVDLEFETGEKLRIKGGESLYIPGGMKHNEYGCSEDLEILELSTPGEMGTVPCDAPAA